jgi:hypothetical protein
VTDAEWRFPEQMQNAKTRPITETLEDLNKIHTTVSSTLFLFRSNPQLLLHRAVSSGSEIYIPE